MTEFISVWFLGVVIFPDGSKRVLLRSRKNPYRGYVPWVDFKEEYEERRSSTMLEF